MATRDEIKARIWGEENYGDHEKGINFLVHQLRSVLDDQAAEPKYIETVPRYGYRLIPPAVPDEPSAPESSNPGRLAKQTAIAMVLGLILLVGWFATHRGGEGTQPVAEVEPEISGPVLEAFATAQYQLTRHRELEAEIWPSLDFLLRAREQLQLVVQAAPEFAPGHRTLAEVHLLLGEGRECAASLGRALALAPESPETLLLTAKFNLYYARHFKVALEQVDRALAAGADRVNSLLIRARILSAMGRHGESQITLIEGLDLSSRSPGLLRGGARLAFYRKDYDEAIRLAREALTLEPKDAVVWRTILDAYQQMGDETSAQATANNFLAAWGNEPDLIESVEEFRRLDLAERMWSQVESENLASRGMIWLALGELDAAIDLLLDACRQGAIGDFHYLRVDPRLDPLREHPRFAELERCVFESVPAVPVESSRAVGR